MAGFYRVLSFLLWLAGLLSLVLAVLWRVLPLTRFNHNIEVHSLLVFAAVLFLGAIATFAMGRNQAP